MHLADGKDHVVRRIHFPGVDGLPAPCGCLERISGKGVPSSNFRYCSAWAKHGVVQEAIRAIKAKYPDFYVITDVCMCEAELDCFVTVALQNMIHD